MTAMKTILGGLAAFAVGLAISGARTPLSAQPDPLCTCEFMGTTFPTDDDCIGEGSINSSCSSISGRCFIGGWGEWTPKAGNCNVNDSLAGMIHAHTDAIGGPSYFNPTETRLIANNNGIPWGVFSTEICGSTPQYPGIAMRIYHYNITGTQPCTCGQNVVYTTVGTELWRCKS